MNPEVYTLADPDYYTHVFARADREPQIRPARVPAGWVRARTGPWTRWTPSEGLSPQPALRVYATARADRLRHVLDAFSARCFERGIEFRHVSSRAHYEILQHEGGPRIQAGRFCTAYPASAAVANELMRALHVALADEYGPAVPTARPYRDSSVVYYGRANAYSWSELSLDGTHVRVTEDELLDGPAFAGAASNAGRTYTARTADGGTVFVEQVLMYGVPAADGMSASDRLRDRWYVLKHVHALAPGLLPYPVDYAEEHPRACLITEAVGGIPLVRWMTANNPIANPSAEPDDWKRYHERVEHVLSQLERDLRRLRAIGYPVTRLDRRHILIDEADSVRLTVFTLAGLAGRGGPDPGDEAIVSELALNLLTAAAPAAKRNPDALGHIHRDLTRRGPLAPELWRKAAARCATGAEARLPAPDEVAANPCAALALLRDRVADGISAAASTEDPHRVFPTVPHGYQTNTLAVAYGTAGVVHALGVARVPVPGWITRRLRDEAVARAAELPPGLFTGLAGIAWVLADRGLVDEAKMLLDHADRHPLTRRSATLAWGASGVAMAHLALYGHTGDEFHIDRALALMKLPDTPADLSPLLGPNDMTGLWYGRAGVAHALGQVAGVTGERRLRHAGLRLLHAELDRAKETAAGELVFPASATDRRALYYLYCGTAGFLTVAGRYLAADPDERLREALPKLVKKASITHIGHAGLGQGLAGLGLALAECGEAAGDAAWTTARALFQHARPHDGTVRFLGDLNLRYSCDLWSGASGVLLFLAHLLDPAPDPLFTVDRLALSGATPMSARRPIEREPER